MEKLKSIFKSLKNIPRENKKAYLISVGMGVGAGVLMMFIHFINNIFVNYGLDAYTFFLLFDNLFLILILIFFFILSRKIPTVWKNTKIKIACVFLLLLVYIISFYFPVCLNQFSISCFLWLPLAPFITLLFAIIWSFEYPTQSPLLITFLYSSIFIIIAAYLATKGITNLTKRIILFLIFAFLICATAATPLIAMHGAG